MSNGVPLDTKSLLNFFKIFLTTFRVPPRPSKVFQKSFSFWGRHPIHKNVNFGIFL